MEKISFEGLRADKHLTQEECAKALGISLLTYRNKELGRREFKFNELIVLSELFGCSIDTFKHP